MITTPEGPEHEVARLTMPIDKMVAMMMRVYGREAWEQAWDAHMTASEGLTQETKDVIKDVFDIDMDEP